MGFVLIAYAETEYQAIVGVVCTSLSLGIGEVTMLAYSAQFNKNVISTWSSGTGGAGIIGAFSYALLVELGLTPKTTLLIMLFVPALEALTFWILLRRPQSQIDSGDLITPPVNEIRKKSLTLVKLDVERRLSRMNNAERPLTGVQAKLKLLPSLMKYIIPMVLVFFFEYIINSGMVRLIQVLQTENI